MVGRVVGGKWDAGKTESKAVLFSSSHSNEMTVSLKLPH